MNISFRPASKADQAWCREIYMEAMQPLMGQFPDWDLKRLENSFHQSFKLEEVEIILSDKKEIGWLQQQVQKDKIILGQIYIDQSYRGQGMGEKTIHLLLDKAKIKKLPYELWVMKNNPARRLYEKLGFKIIGENEIKYQMQWDG